MLRVTCESVPGEIGSIMPIQNKRASTRGGCPEAARGRLGRFLRGEAVKLPVWLHEVTVWGLGELSIVEALRVRTASVGLSGVGRAAHVPRHRGADRTDEPLWRAAGDTRARFPVAYADAAAAMGTEIEQQKRQPSRDVSASCGPPPPPSSSPVPQLEDGLHPRVVC
ncbi:hypothetical protein MTO96_007312 [Rhipicephalus appendiculatus]